MSGDSTDKSSDWSRSSDGNRERDPEPPDENPVTRAGPANIRRGVRPGSFYEGTVEPMSTYGFSVSQGRHPRRPDSPCYEENAVPQVRFPAPEQGPWNTSNIPAANAPTWNQPQQPFRMPMPQPEASYQYQPLVPPTWGQRGLVNPQLNYPGMTWEMRCYPIPVQTPSGVCHYYQYTSTPIGTNWNPGHMPMPMPLSLGQYRELTANGPIGWNVSGIGVPTTMPNNGLQSPGQSASNPTSALPYPRSTFSAHEQHPAYQTALQQPYQQERAQQRRHPADQNPGMPVESNYNGNTSQVPAADGEPVTNGNVYRKISYAEILKQPKNPQEEPWPDATAIKLLQRQEALESGGTEAEFNGTPPPPPMELEPAVRNAVAVEENRANLMQQIRQGARLNSVNDKKPMLSKSKSLPNGNKMGHSSPISVSDLQEALKRALSERHRAMHADEENDEDYDDEKKDKNKDDDWAD